MREIDVSVITDTIEKMCISANVHLPKDMQKGIKSCRACEDGPIAQTILDQIIQNFEVADTLRLPTRNRFRSARTQAWPASSWK